MDQSLSHLSGIITDQARRITDLELEKAALRMTLRDEFAMAALTGLMTTPQYTYNVPASEAYKIADAMLEMRKS